MDRTILATVALAFCCVSGSAFGGKKLYIGDRVSPGRQVSMDAIDHRVWDGLLQKHVDQDGMVDYRGFKSSRAEQGKLDSYIKQLSFASPTKKASREAKLAFWINAYNAVTVHGMLREYPTKSIRQHTSNIGGYNIWHDYQLYVGGKAYSLDQIEHQILRKMDEPRIHFAIVCASIGCPRLLSQAYVPGRLEQQLETNAKDFFSRERNFRHDAGRKRFYLSELLSWFGEDFGKDQAAQLRRIAKWLPTAASRQAATKNAVRVSYLKYDWKINEQSQKTAKSRS